MDVLFILFLITWLQISFAFEADTCDSESCNEIRNIAPIINVLITFTNAQHNLELQDKFRLTTRSMFKHTESHINMYILGDDESRKIANGLLKEVTRKDSKFQVKQLDINEAINEMKSTIESMQKRFSPSHSSSYYSQALFFLSPILHRILPNSVEQIIMLDADLKFEADISKLHQHFDNFRDDNIIGIAREAQPVYRHAFSSYRSKHVGTKVGEPPPDGLTGFNSGVLLLDLSKMRKSSLYNNLLMASEFSAMADEFDFKGHLGDQDFYTLISMKYISLFYILPCQWNRQLCQWWKLHGYENVFYLYFDCPGDIHLYHGNCNTQIV